MPNQHDLALWLGLLEIPTKNEILYVAYLVRDMYENEEAVHFLDLMYPNEVVKLMLALHR